MGKILSEEESEGKLREARVLVRRWWRVSGELQRVGQIIFETLGEETSWLRT